MVNFMIPGLHSQSLSLHAQSGSACPGLKCPGLHAHLSLGPSGLQRIRPLEVNAQKMASLLLEAKQLVLRLTPNVEQVLSGDKIRVYARAFLSSCTSEWEPWERMTPWTKETQIDIVEARVDVVERSDGDTNVATATINSCEFHRFGAEINHINELEVSVLFSKYAIIEVRLAVGRSADLTIDPLLGHVRVPLRMALVTGQQKTVDTIAMLCADELANILDDQLPSMMTVSLSTSNELFTFMAGGNILTLGHGKINETSSPPLDDASLEADSFELDVSLQSHRNSPMCTMSCPRATMSATLPDADATAGYLDCTSDSEAPATLFVCAKTMFDVILHPRQWALVLELRPRGAHELRAAALSPAGSLVGHSAVISALLRQASGVNFEQLQVQAKHPGANASVTIACSMVVNSLGLPEKHLRQPSQICDCVPQKRLLRKRSQYDVDSGLSHTVRNVLSKVAIKHDTLRDHGAITTNDPDRSHSRLKASLHQDANSHSFRLDLLSQVQRIIRNQCAARPMNIIFKEEFVGKCYTQIVDLASSLLARLANLEMLGAYADDISTMLSRSLERARDAEANSHWPIALAEHKARTSLAVLSSTSKVVVASTWLNFAQLLLRANRARCSQLALDEASFAIRECLACGVVDMTNVALRLYGAILLEQGRLSEAEATFAVYAWANGKAVDAAFLCILAELRDDGIAAKRAAMRVANALELSAIPCEYRVIAALQKAADYLVVFALVESASTALAMVHSVTYLRAAVNPLAEPQAITAQRYALSARLSNNAENAIVLTRRGTEACENVAAWTALGDSLCNSKFVDAGTEPYACALSRHAELMPLLPRPLDLSIKHARCLLQTNQNVAAQDSYITAAEELQAASLWLGAGAAAVRLGNLAGADRYLRLATIRAPYHSRSYGLLALLYATANENQLYAASLLDIGVKLGLDDGDLFREIGNANFQFERYLVAETLLRRAIAVGHRKGANSHCLKRLADFLSAANAI